VELDAEEFRVVELRDGTLLAHATTCPHWLGPLGAAAEDGIVRCPWHGYLFDIRTGESVDGRGYRLASAPRVASASSFPHKVRSWRRPAEVRQ
jgi:nitrite reductase/ring-hydroxylating ferredoxin subunit